MVDIIKILQTEQDKYSPNWFWIRVTRFLYVTGIRRRQLVHILWEHIDFINETVLICASGSKNYKERKIPLPELLINDLNFLKQKHIDNGIGNFLFSDQVFNITRFNPRYRGSETNVGQITGFYRRFTENTGIGVSPHRFRHTMASQIGNSPDVNILTLSNILGHSDLRVTRQYVETDLRPQMELVKKLEENLTKAPK